ncbi:MAG: spermidine/putrescine ABC transporter substrate-binding protein [Terrimesophilobacter sp.]
MTPSEPIRPLSRRQVLQGVGIATAALGLAACSPAEPARPTKAKDVSETQRSLRFDGRETYRNTVGEDFPLLEKFDTESGIAVTYTAAVSEDNVYYSKIKDQLKLGNDIGADAVVLADWMAARWLRFGYVQEFRRENLSNFGKLRLQFQDAAFDPGRQRSLPWRSGLTGVAWNTAAIPGGLTSVSDLWDPSLHGKVGVMSAMRDTVGSIMLDQGVDIESADWGDSEFSAAVTVLAQQVAAGQVKSIKGKKYKDDLKSGATVAAIARADDIMQINEEAGDHWEFALPSAGGVLSSDSVVIPIGSAHRANAEDFVNFYLSPANAVKVVEATNVISPVDIHQPELGSIPASVSRDPLLFPSEALLKTTRTFRTLSQGEEQRYGAQYQTVLLRAL